MRPGGGVPTLDFAGGTVVHITSGVSALVCALYLGKRLHYPKGAMPPHSVVLSFIGAGLLWVGWFGFNAGSALARDAGHQRLCGHAFRGGRGGYGLEPGGMDPNGKPSAGSDLRGGRGAGRHHSGGRFRWPMSALAIGFLAGLFCYFMVVKVKAMVWI